LGGVISSGGIEPSLASPAVFLFRVLANHKLRRAAMADAPGDKRDFFVSY
jgi:hypothetical protein